MNLIRNLLHHQAALRLAALMFVLLALSGCTRFFYNHADWLINWYVDDYIDFNRTQKKVFDQQLDQLIKWHRQKQLPEYQIFLETLLDDIEHPMSAKLIEQRSDQTLIFWQTFMSTAMSDVSDLFLQLSDNQVDDFIENLEKEQRKLEKEQPSTDKEQRVRDNVKQVEQSLQRFIGSTTDKQHERIKQWANEPHDIYKASVHQRREWQHRLVEAFKTRSLDPNRFRQNVTSLFVHPHNYWSDDYKKLVEQNRQQSFAMLSDIQ